MLSIVQCEVCTQLQQRTRINYRCSEKRPDAVRLLEPLARRPENENRDTDTELTLLTCGVCGTFYLSRWYKLENDFMCPSYDEETIRRLSIDAALAALTQYGNDTHRAELASRKSECLDGLAAMLIERRAPTWHIQRHAIECLIDDGILHNKPTRLETVLAHPDAVVRADGAYHAIDVATRDWAGAAELIPALRKAATHFAQKGRPQRAIESVLDEPPRESLRCADGHYYASDTHVTVAEACMQAASRDLPLGNLLARLLILLGGEHAVRRQAESALCFAIDHHPDVKPRVLAAIDALPVEQRAALTYLRDKAAK
jgi:hypothetical protein